MTQGCGIAAFAVSTALCGGRRAAHPKDMGLTLPVAKSSPNAPSFRVIALIVAVALFMEQLDATVISTSLPAMARSFDVKLLHMSVALTSYLLSLAIFIPASGVIADRFGTRRVFNGAIILFTLGSILCAQAPSLSLLVAARVIQGAGGAMMIPVGRLILLRAGPKKDMVSAMAWFLIPALIGPVIGPPLGGFITTYLSWRWISTSTSRSACLARSCRPY